jgi:acylphosphatase
VPVRKRVLYSGQVQGVGFRYTTRELARGFAVTGFVRNLPDGRVELVAEGEADEVTDFLDALAERMASYVESHTIHDEPPAALRGFVIRS